MARLMTYPQAYNMHNKTDSELAGAVQDSSMTSICKARR